ASPATARTAPPITTGPGPVSPERSGADDATATRPLATATAGASVGVALDAIDGDGVAAVVASGVGAAVTGAAVAAGVGAAVRTVAGRTSRIRYRPCRWCPPMRRSWRSYARPSASVCT